jgi:hypothetical protein
MTLRHLLLCGLSLTLLSGCTSSSPITSTDPRNPVRLYLVADKPLAPAERILLLPPIGVADTKIRHDFQQQLFRSAQRHFTTPSQMVTGNSAYAVYLSESNLTRPDGSFNLPEITSIGRLMNASHVICPTIREIRPYYPQKISLSITVISTETGKITAELSGIFDAGDPVVQDYFKRYRTATTAKDRSPNDLPMELRSPTLFQTFVTEMCCTMMADRLPL